MSERINPRRTAIALGILVLAVAGVVLTHRWQVRRNIAGVLELADRAEAQSRPDRTAWLLAYYLTLVPGDTTVRARAAVLSEAAARDAKAFVVVADEYERVLAEAPERDDIRLRLGRLYVLGKKYPEAVARLSARGFADGPNAEAVRLLAMCHDAGGDWPAAIKTYRRALELDPGRVNVYVRLAVLLREHGGATGPADADQVVDQLIKANPQDAIAHIARASYRKQYGAGDPAPDLARAVELEPTSAEVRLAVAGGAKSADEARGHLRAGFEHHPEHAGLCLELARAEVRAGNRAVAADVLRQGAVRLPGHERLLFARADLALDSGDLPEAERALAELARWNRAPEQVTLRRGRLRMAEGNWLAARSVLEAGRPALTTTSAQLAAEGDVLLGVCHEQLGEGDRALASYRLAAASDRARSDAQVGIARVLVSLNRLGEAIEQYQQLVAAPGVTADTWLMYARLRVIQYITTPPTVRRAAELEPYLTRVAEMAPDSLELLLLRVEVLAADRRLEDAEKLLRRALDQKPNQAEVGIPLARLKDKQGKAAEALTILNTLDQVSGGASVATALARLELLAGSGDGRTVESAAWTEVSATAAALAGRAGRAEDRLRLFTALADAHVRWRDAVGARRWCLEVARLRPHDLSVRIQLLDIAVLADDRTQMEEAAQEIRRAEGLDGPVGHYAQAVLRIARPKDRSAAGYREAREHLTAASLSRPAWPALSTCRGVLTELEGASPDDALSAYLAAIELGERSSGVVRRAVQMLCDRNRYTEASALLQKLHNAGRGPAQFGRLAAELMLRDKQLERAVDLARDLAGGSKEHEEHLWLAEVLSAAGDRIEAVAAFRKAISLAGAHAAPWVGLVRHYARNSQPAEAEKVLAELRASLSGPELSLAVAQCLDALGRTEDAAAAFQQAVDSRPGDMESLRQLFEFHDRNRTHARAVPALRRGLAAGSPLPPTAVSAVRRALAIALASSGGPAAFQEAIRTIGAADSAEDKLAKARILATRLCHRRDALAVLQQLRTPRGFPSDVEFLYGQLLADTGSWDEGRRVLVSLLGRELENVAYRRFFVDRLIRHGELGEAETRLVSLEALAPTDLAVVRLRATLLVKRGDFRDAAECLQHAARVPGAKGASNSDTRDRQRGLARAADDLAYEPDAGPVLFPVAESLYRAAAKDGTTSDELGLISFLAARGKIDEAIDCGRATAVPADKAAVASALIGGAFRNSDLTAGQLDRLESEVRVCLSQGKVSTAHAQILALTHARRGRYADAVKQLRGVGDINSVGPEVLNNLAYMMILAGEREANIMPILERGIAAVGPVAGLLDTRGMVHLAAGRTKEAVADLEQAVDQVPSAAKCLHLAMAYHCEGRSKEAAAALARSNALRADGSLVLPAERELHQKIKAALGSEHK